MTVNQKLAAGFVGALALVAGAFSVTELVEDDATSPAPAFSAPVVNGVMLESEFTYKTLTIEGPVWTPLQCSGDDEGKGAEVLDGVGEVRMRAWATNVRGGSRRIPFRTNFQTPAESRSKFWAERWYSNHTHTLPPGERVEIADVVHDLETNQDLYLLDLQAGTSSYAGLSAECVFGAENVPDVNRLATTSHRTTPVNAVDRLRLTVEEYADGTPLSCGGPTNGRVRIRGFALDAEGGRFDFHWHQEVMGSIGPDQDLDNRDTRFAEEGSDSILLAAGVEREVLSVVTGVSANGRGKGRHQSFHFAQQGPAPMNQVFCHLDSPSP